MANKHYSQEIDESIGLNLPNFRNTGVFLSSLGLGAISLGLDTVYNVASGARNFSREHNLSRRITDGARSLGTRALSFLGDGSKPSDGTFVGTPEGAGYVVGGVDSSRPASTEGLGITEPPQRQQETGDII